MDLANGQFCFKLEPATKDENNNDWSSSTTIPMPNGAAGNVASAVNNAFGTITFEPITYSLDHYDNGKIYYYLLTEDSSAAYKQNNITYSTERYLIKAEVSAEVTEDKPLRVTTTYYKDKNGTWEQVRLHWMLTTT